MSERQALDAKASTLMVGLCMLWGIQQVVFKIAAPDISTLMQVALRSGLSALMLYPLIKLADRRRLWRKDYLYPGMFAAVLFAIEFLMLAQSLRFTSASHGVVLLYTAPIFVALGLHWKLPSERLSTLQWSGIFLAFLGIVATFVGRDSSGSAHDVTQVLWGDFLALLAGIFWAGTTIVVRLTKLSEAPATQTLFYQLLGGFILLFPLTFMMGQASIHWTSIAIGSLIFHTLLISLMSYLLWFALLKRYLASRLGVFSFLTPLFGMIFGVWLLNEKLEMNFIVGTAMVLLGVIVVSLQGWLTPHQPAK